MLISYHKSSTCTRTISTVDTFYSITQFKFFLIAIENLFQAIMIVFPVIRMYPFLPDSTRIVHIF